MSALRLASASTCPIAHSNQARSSVSASTTFTKLPVDARRASCARLSASASGAARRRARLTRSDTPAAFRSTQYATEAAAQTPRPTPTRREHRPAAGGYAWRARRDSEPDTVELRVPRGWIAGDYLDVPRSEHGIRRPTRSRPLDCLHVRTKGSGQPPANSKASRRSQPRPPYVHIRALRVVAEVSPWSPAPRRFAASASTPLV